MPEYGREYWEAHQSQRRLTLAQLVEVAQGHRQPQVQLRIAIAVEGGGRLAQLGQRPRGLATQREHGAGEPSAQGRLGLGRLGELR